MKKILLISLLISSSVYAHSTTLDHQCLVSKTVQIFNTETGRSKFFSGSTSKFDVTKAEHEEAYEVSILNTKDASAMGIAKVDTGTLLGTDDGDLIQAHASVNVNGTQESLGLIASTESPLARSLRVFDYQSGENEITMVNIDLQCEIKR